MHMCTLEESTLGVVVRDWQGELVRVGCRRKKYHRKADMAEVNIANFMLEVAKRSCFLKIGYGK